MNLKLSSRIQDQIIIIIIIKFKMEIASGHKGDDVLHVWSISYMIQDERVM